MIELIFSKLHPIPPTQLFCSQKKQQNKKTSNGLRIHASWRTPAQLADWRRRTWTWGAPQIIDQNQSIADRERVHTGTFRRGERRIVRTKRERDRESETVLFEKFCFDLQIVVGTCHRVCVCALRTRWSLGQDKERWHSTFAVTPITSERVCVCVILFTVAREAEENSAGSSRELIYQLKTNTAETDLAHI